MNSNNKKKNSARELYIKRVKYLMGTDYKELSQSDRINRILIKIILDSQEYQLLKLWYISKWSIVKTSDLMTQSKCETEKQISKIITKLKPVVWDHNNNPFIKDEDREKFINKNTWIGDLVMEKFLDTDLVMISVDEYLDMAMSYSE
ncbi:hypothetical protein FDB40_17220 [Clostridium botulinum]|nr:hypothetical protein [Clostridium botulinum]